MQNRKVILSHSPSHSLCQACFNSYREGGEREGEREEQTDSELAEGGIQRDTVTVCPWTAFALSFWVPESQGAPSHFLGLI